MTAAARPWRDRVNWWTNPRLAYAVGQEDGYAAGYEAGRADADADLVQALAWALSGGATTDYRRAVSIHHRTLDARARRATLDRGEAAA